MSCSNYLSDLPDFNCGGQIRKVQIIDSKGKVVQEHVFRKWERHTLENLIQFEARHVYNEDYETAAEIRDEIKLRQ